MKIGTSAKKLALVAGVFAVCGLGILAPSASARPKKEVKVKVKQVRRVQPVVRTRTVVRNRTVYRPRTVVQRRPAYRDPYNTRPSIYTGRVLSVSSGRLVFNVGGNVYTAILASGLPRGISRDDIVRVVGVRNGGSIRNARVSMIRNF